MRKIYSTGLSKRYLNSDPINCSAPLTSHHNNNMTHRYNQASASYSIRGLTAAPSPTWNINLPSIPASSFSSWTHCLKQQAASVRCVYGDDSGLKVLSRSGSPRHSGPAGPSSAGSRANKPSARENKEDTEVVWSCSHRGRSHFQELVWGWLC